MNKVLFIINPIEELSLKKDTSVVMMEVALQKGFEVYFCYDSLIDFEQSLKIKAFKLNTINQQSFDYNEQVQDIQASNFVFAFMRIDPPFNLNYIYLTYMLDHLEQSGCRVINSPNSLRKYNEKFIVSYFNELTPKSIFTKNLDTIHQFIKENEYVVGKKLNSMGGSFIFHLRKDDVNQNSILEALTQEETYITLQKYLPEYTQGDKRIFIFNNQVYPIGLRRMPQQNETSANLMRGGKGIAEELSEKEIKIANQIAQKTKNEGLFFIGFDLIGEWVTEINVTSPTGAREILEQTGNNPMQEFFEQLIQN